MQAAHLPQHAVDAVADAQKILFRFEMQVGGPALDGIGAQAASRVPGLSAYDYILQSITEPGAYVVQPFADGLMPRDFKIRLSDEQIQILVEFLLGQ